MRKLITVLLMMVMLLSMAACALAADAGPVWVGNVMLRDGDMLLQGASAPIQYDGHHGEDGYAYYKNGVLTLNNFTINDSTAYGMDYSAGIYTNHPLTIDVNGDNCINASCSGIVARGTSDETSWLVLQGPGSLKIVSNHVGIYSLGDLMLRCAALRIESLANADGTMGRGITSDGGRIDVRSNAYVNVLSARTSIRSRMGLSVTSGSRVHAYAYKEQGLKLNEGEFSISDGAIVTLQSAEDGTLILGEDVVPDLGYHIVAEAYPDGVNQAYSISGNREFESNLKNLQKCKKLVFRDGPPMYKVSVTNGASQMRFGDDYPYAQEREYRENREIVLLADAPPAGSQFDHWEGLDGLTFPTDRDQYDAQTVFVMPQKDVLAKAVYVSDHTCAAFIDQRDAFEHWKVCEHCGAEKPDSRTAHTFEWKHDSSRHWQACSACGYIDVVSVGLHWYADSDGKCICGQFKPHVIAKPESGPSYELDMDKIPAEDRTMYPITITKKLTGIADLPDGMEFVIEIYDTATGGRVGGVVVGKDDLLGTGSVSFPAYVPEEFAIGERIAGYADLYDMKVGCVYTGLEMREVYPGGGSKTVPVGAFKYKDPFVEIDGPGGDLPNNPNGRMFVPAPAVAEIVITNELTPRPVNLPRTGDESDALLWACAALVSGAAAVLLMRRKRSA